MFNYVSLSLIIWSDTKKTKARSAISAPKPNATKSNKSDIEKMRSGVGRSESDDTQAKSCDA